jgi:hypothetical protein
VPRALGQVLIANVDATNECDFVVDQQHLSMVSPKTANEQCTQAVVNPGSAASLPQG